MTLLPHPPVQFVISTKKVDRCPARCPATNRNLKVRCFVDSQKPSIREVKVTIKIRLKNSTYIDHIHKSLS